MNLTTMLILIFVSTCLSLTIRVEPSREDCFFEKVEHEHAKLLLQYQVASGGFLDIDVTIFDPQHNVIHKSERESEGKINFNAEKSGD
jgi:hypothetical protein